VTFQRDELVTRHREQSRRQACKHYVST